LRCFTKESCLEGIRQQITAVKHSSLSPLSHAIDYHKAHAFLDVSVALRTTQLYIHKIQLQLNVESTYYHNIMVSSGIRVGPAGNEIIICRTH
jgi:hypothetical protein